MKNHGLAAAYAAFVVLLLAPTLYCTWIATSARRRRYALEDAQYRRLAAVVRRCTDANDRIAALPYYPRFYFESDRLPATTSVHYLPWQAAWEPQREATMRSLHQHAPKVVMVQDLNIWGVPWTKYGAEIESWIRKRYSPVIVDGEAERFVGARLYVFNDRAQDFVRCAHRQY